MTDLTYPARAAARLSTPQRFGILALLVLTASGLGAGAMSLAIFSDTTTSTGTFASGTIGRSLVAPPR